MEKLVKFLKSGGRACHFTLNSKEMLIPNSSLYSARPEDALYIFNNKGLEELKKTFEAVQALQNPHATLEKAEAWEESRQDTLAEINSAYVRLVKILKQYQTRQVQQYNFHFKAQTTNTKKVYYMDLFGRETIISTTHSEDIEKVKEAFDKLESQYEEQIENLKTASRKREDHLEETAEKFHNILSNALEINDKGGPGSRKKVHEILIELLSMINIETIEAKDEDGEPTEIIYFFS